MTHIPRKPAANGKIIVDDLETKLKVIELSSFNNESMKSFIKRLVDEAHKQFMKDEEQI
jgi:hypothetical protein